ncbi:MAG: DUF559 domain-containing protein, partial [Vallitaleaceae bacterium]|nr:DUF559 domain-containing protein [Vallitaleaceae bacterium]
KNAHLLDEEKVNWWNVGKVIRRVTHSKERKKNDELFRTEETRLIHYYETSGKIINGFLEKANPLFELLNDEGKKKLLLELLTLSQVDTTIMAYLESLGNKELHQELSVSTKALNELDQQLLSYSYQHSETTEKMETLLDDLLEFIILEQIQEIEKTPEFAEFYQSLNRFEEITKEIHRLLNANEGVTQNIVNTYWNESIQKYIDTPEYKELRRQAEKKRQLWPIRKMLQEFQDLIFAIYPCWLMSPETVSDVLPLRKDSFDLLIFDEASQMFVENSIPTIYRAAKVVVAGDDKQLRPTSAFVTRIDDEEMEAFDMDTAAAREEESLLDLAKVNYQQVYLNYHYRSKFEELIQFSNHAFYGGRLNVAPNRTKLHYDKTTPIERIKISGKWVNRKNNEEANRVVELVDHLLRNRSESETIGIITFNINQKDLIEDLLDARCQIDSVFRKLYEEELVRKKKDEDISIFVKNIENVQGDERDIIIFSVGYAPNEEGKISVNFGSLSQDGGENRLNVAISRAKKKCYVITSIEPEELIVAKTKNNGARLFKQYLQYAKEVSNSDAQRKNFVLNQLNTQNAQVLEKENDEFAMEIGNRLKKAGYQVEMNIGSGSYRLDLAIWDEKKNAYVLGIECDTSLYTNGQSTKERDIYRQQFYEARGWTVMRVWSYDWWKNPDRIIEKIIHRLEEKYPEQGIVATKPVEEVYYQLVESKTDKGQADAICWYGDLVLLKDLISKEVFKVEIDGTEETKEQLNNFKQLLPGKKVGSRIAYRNYEYVVDAIMKKGTNTL